MKFRKYTEALSKIRSGYDCDKCICYPPNLRDYLSLDINGNCQETISEITGRRIDNNPLCSKLRELLEKYFSKRKILVE